jgi:OOP family OmpA-OmpF porin
MERLGQLQAMFEPLEVKVLRDEMDRVVLRVVGMSFPPGSDRIEPVYFDLLSRVQKALAIFPSAQVVVEGHTDSMGDETSNQILSQQRADAIRQYLLANSTLIPANVSAVGYGEARPVANNETEAGRTLNRRVDVVVLPSD